MDDEVSYSTRPVNLWQDEVKAILAGRQSVFRRPLRPQPHGDGTGKPIKCEEFAIDGYVIAPAMTIQTVSIEQRKENNHYGKPGDRLWVKEQFAFSSGHDPLQSNHDPDMVLYRAGGAQYFKYDTHVSAGFNDDLGECDLDMCDGQGWKSSTHMPKWMSRLELEILSIHIRQIQKIDGYNAMDNGMRANCDADCCDGVTKAAFVKFWNANVKASYYKWTKNPWVYEVAFRKI